MPPSAISVPADNDTLCNRNQEAAREQAVAVMILIKRLMNIRFGLLGRI